MADSPALDAFVKPETLRALIEQARIEDMGPDLLDVTSELLIPEAARGTAAIRARKPGILAGAAMLPAIARVYDPDIALHVFCRDGQQLEPHMEVARCSGSLRSLLAMERIALNFLTHLSGIATLTAQYVQAVAGTRAAIYDTRKTIPTLRGLAKYAVRCGGGRSHRIGLYDAVLVKDNHLAHYDDGAELSAAVTELVGRARGRTPPPAFVEVEVDRLDQLEHVLACGVDVVLLDNMTPQQMRQAVTLRNGIAEHIVLEASGGVTLESVVDVAATGVDRIAVGALTHSAAALDLGMDIVADGA